MIRFLFCSIFLISSLMLKSSLWGGENASNELKIFNKNQNLPLDINADNGIVYDHENNRCTASGNVKALYGNYILKCHQLVAFFRHNKAGKNELWKVEALGDVVISSTQDHHQVYAQKGLYNIDQNYIILTGKNLHLIADNLNVTAEDSLEYSCIHDIAYAKGHAVAKKDDHLIKGDILEVSFKENAQGNKEFHHIKALKNVMISTPNEIATSDKGVYHKIHDLATLEGNVKISKPYEQIQGNYGEVEFNAGISRILSQNPNMSSLSSKPQRVQLLLLTRPKKQSEKK